MTGLTLTVYEAIDERITDPTVRHPRARTEEEVAREFPDAPRPARLVHVHKGQRFRPHGTDSVGVIVSHPRQRRTVQFFYVHAPDVLHSINAYEFTDRFARLFGPRRRHTPAKVRHVRPTPVGAVQAVREAA